MLALTFHSAPLSATWLQFPLHDIPRYYMFLPLCSISFVVQTSPYFFARQETTKHFTGPGIQSAKTKHFTSSTTFDFCETCFKWGEDFQFREVVSLDTCVPDARLALPRLSPAIPSRFPICVSSLLPSTSSRQGRGLMLCLSGRDQPRSWPRPNAQTEICHLPAGRISSFWCFLTTPSLL